MAVLHFPTSLIGSVFFVVPFAAKLLTVAGIQHPYISLILQPVVVMSLLLIGGIIFLAPFIMRFQVGTILILIMLIIVVALITKFMYM